jgi:hypothetical protein
MAIGDQVQVVRASQEIPRHKGQTPVSKKPGIIDPLRGLKTSDAPVPDTTHDARDPEDGGDEGN